MKLKEARAEKLYSMERLAREAGVSLSTIRNTEAGTSVPTLAMVDKLSRALGIDPKEVDEFAAAIEAAARGRKPRISARTA